MLSVNSVAVRPLCSTAESKGVDIWVVEERDNCKIGCKLGACRISMFLSGDRDVIKWHHNSDTSCGTEEEVFPSFTTDILFCFLADQLFASSCFVCVCEKGSDFVHVGPTQLHFKYL